MNLALNIANLGLPSAIFVSRVVFLATVATRKSSVQFQPAIYLQYHPVTPTHTFQNYNSEYRGRRPPQ
jgi:hypothetical protein